MVIEISTIRIIIFIISGGGGGGGDGRLSTPP